MANIFNRLAWRMLDGVFLKATTLKIKHFACEGD